MPSFKLATTESAIASNSDGNSDLNVESLRGILEPSSFRNFGGGTSDNAPDAIKTTCLTFEKGLKLIEEEHRVINGVARRVIVWGDPFHVANLVVSHASLAAFGDTERGNYQDVHHRSIQQRLNEVTKDNKDLCGLVCKDLSAQYGLAITPTIGVARERQQRWMVNQRASEDILRWFHLDCGGESFLLRFLEQLASLLRSRCGWQADAAETAARLVTIPGLRTGLHFESELGSLYFQVVMAFHARKGLFADRAGFRMLEVHRFLFRFELPFWKKAMTEPDLVFVETFKSLAAIESEDERAKKKQQLYTGIKAGFDELVQHRKC